MSGAQKYAVSVAYRETENGPEVKNKKSTLETNVVNRSPLMCHLFVHGPHAVFSISSTNVCMKRSLTPGCLAVIRLPSTTTSAVPFPS
jgi:hypothetical protein